MRRWIMCLIASLLCFNQHSARAEALFFPILAPLTGFLSLEGTSQRNGALLALEHAPKGMETTTEVIDTGVAPEGAVTAFERAAGRATITAATASMLGVQMLALLPLAEERRVPLITVSGTAAITERGNRWVFRFFPGDAVTKRAHAQYVVEEMKRVRPALITQTTAYGQSGRLHLKANFAKFGVTPVFDEAIDPGVKDMLPVLSRALEATPDVLVLHLHSGPTALFVRQAAAFGKKLPIVAGSAMHQPSTAALLEPAELQNVCAETAASPISGGSPEMEAFVAAYRARFKTDPDAFALGQYDGVQMALKIAAFGSSAPETLRVALNEQTYQGLAMTYHSDGNGNMAHSASIICYDGVSRTPKVVKRYSANEQKSN
ncbi:ABC transporter substrate-binding protein [Azospirillaceae bacterium]